MSKVGFKVSPSEFRTLAIRTLCSKGIQVRKNGTKNVKLIMLLRQHTDLVLPEGMTKKQIYEAVAEQVVARKPSLAKVLKSRPAKSPDRAPSEDKIKDFYASWEWKRLSYDVKLERGRTCECCGAKAPNVVIHTDHIKPIRHFWHLRLDKTNLQVLCEDCNMGKGSRDHTDFRALNVAQEMEPEPELSEADRRLLAIKEQLRLN